MLSSCTPSNQHDSTAMCEAERPSSNKTAPVTQVASPLYHLAASNKVLQNQCVAPTPVVGNWSMCVCTSSALLLALSRNSICERPLLLLVAHSSVSLTMPVHTCRCYNTLLMYHCGSTTSDMQRWTQASDTVHSRNSDQQYFCTGLKAHHV